MGLVKWLQTRLGRRPPRSLGAVTFDGEKVSHLRDDGSADSIRWDDLQAVYIDTTDWGPFLEDVYFVLADKEWELAVPQRAVGTDALLKRVGELPGFDHGAACDAMCCTENHRFVCWKRGNDATDAVE